MFVRSATLYLKGVILCVIVDRPSPRDTAFLGSASVRPRILFVSASAVPIDLNVRGGRGFATRTTAVARAIEYTGGLINSETGSTIDHEQIYVRVKRACVV